MSSVEEALKAREERKKKNEEGIKAKIGKIDSAVEAYKNRKKSAVKNASTDIAKRINAVIEEAKNTSTPSWGADSFKNTMDSTRENRVKVSDLKREVESYKDYLDDDAYNAFIDALNVLDKGYSNIVEASEVYSMFESQAAFDEYKAQYDERQAVLSDENFDHYSQIGASIENPTYAEANGSDNWLGWKNPFVEGEEIKNIVTFSRDNIDHITEVIASSNNNGDLGDVLGDYRYQFLTDEEVSIYNYYLGKGDNKKAEEFLASLDDTLNQRHAGKVAENVSGNAFLEGVFAINAGLDQFASGIANLDNLIMGTEADPTTVTQYANAIVRENIDGVGGVAYDLLQNTAYMLPSILVSYIPVVGKPLALAATGLSAAGSGYAEMRNLGYNEDQARAYGVMVGAAEAGLQYVLGGFSKLGGKLSGKAIGNLASKFDSAIARTAIQVGGSMASEALEEATQTVLESVIKALATGEDFEAPEWEEVWYSALLGALSAGTLEGSFNIAGTAINSHKATKLYGDSASALVAESLDIDPENAHAQRMQTRLDNGKSVSGYQLNRLVEANEQTLYKQDKGKIASSVAERLAQLGEKGDVSKLSEVIAKKMAGESLSMSEKSILKNSKYGQRVINEMTPSNMDSGEYTSKWAENIGTERIATDAYNKGLYDLALEQAGVSLDEGNASVTENTTEKENASESKFEVSTDGKTKVDDKEVSIKEIAAIKDGEIMLRLEDGSTVKASEVEFSSNEEGLLYENVVHMNLNAATANAFIKGYDPSMSVQEYALGFGEAYRYGEYGFPMREMSTDGFSAKLSESQKNFAYNLGKTDAKYKVEKKQSEKAKIASTDAVKAGKDSQKTSKKGKLHNTLTPSTERQKASLKALGVLAETLGIDVYTFESDVVDGKRQGANGWFDPKDGSIHIDIHAGINGEGTMLFTAAHELTHFIREWSPAKFKVFADFLLEQYGKKGVSVDALVREQIEKAKRNGRDISYDTAYEEVVADSCEAMLADGDAIAKIAELKAMDKTLWQKIKDFLSNLVARIKSAYEGMTPDTVEGRFVSEMLDSAEKLKQMWTEALVEASNTYASSERALGENGISVDSNTESASLMSVRDLLNSEQQQKVAETLATRFGVTVKEAKAWISAETSLASLILNPKYSQYLDYTADANEEAIKSNSDYPQGTVDFSNICKKRRDFTEVMNRVLRNFPNHVFEATDLAKIRTIMMEEGMEVACGICYVEDRRQLDSVVAQDFLDSLSLYREGSKTRPDGKNFNANQLKALSLIDGDSYTPSIYELVSLEGRNKLKAKDPAMEEAWVKFNNARGMQSVRLLLNDAEYKRQILDYKPSVVKRKNDLGGLRIYSFSDAEMFHLIDIIQVITDSATVGLSLQGYTKVNEYAKAVKDTGEKLNRSLIPKGDLGYHMEGGKVVLDYDTVEGIDVNHPDFFDNIDNPNIGNILIGINKTQIKAAMVSKFVDQIIPFHTGQSNDVLGEKGIAAWVNYKDFQSERDLGTGKKSAHQINIYTEVIQAAEAEGHPITNKVEFVNKFLAVCKENSLEPRFSEFLNVDENGDYVYTEGYHKFLVDFKTFDQNTGEYLPQMPVKPIFDNAYITGLLKAYVKSQKAKDANLAKAIPKVLDRITNEIVKPNEVKLSDRDSLGNELSAEQQEFFKDSKVRDKKGNLMVLYHGTTANFNTFKKGDVGFHFGTKGAARGRVGFGKNVALKEVYLNITNPIVFDEDLGSWDADFRLTRELYDMGILTQEDAESVLFTDDRKYKRNTEATNKKLASVLLNKGYDGIQYSNTFETKKVTTSYIVFNSNQAKEITNKTPTNNPDIRYSDRDSYAPTFYSYMGKVIDGIRLEKMGAGGVVSFLKGKGVKSEEIKWSGIEAFLEGKKSVTKAELQEFVAGSQLQIVEQMSGKATFVADDGNTYESEAAFKDAAYAIADKNRIARSRVKFVIDTEYDMDAYAYVGSPTNSILTAEVTDAEGTSPRWSQYKIDGGTNYRELVFQLPNSSYSNRAMRGHWGQDAEGVLAHARTQDITTKDGKKMLFIEEIQSDWHNEGHQKGYTTEEYEEAVAVYDKLAENYENKRRAFNKYVRSGEFRSDPDDVSKKKFDWLRRKMDEAEKRMQDAERDVEALKKKGMGDVPDAPFRDTYHEYVLKRLLRMAAEEGYDSIGWTPSKIQTERWSDEYAEGYRIEYDQDIPKFLRKYGKKWGAIVGNADIAKEAVGGKERILKETELKNVKRDIERAKRELARKYDSYEKAVLQRSIDSMEKTVATLEQELSASLSVWSMSIPDSMKESVLYEGQVMYSDRVTDKKTLDFLENQEHITTYKSFVEIDGKLYSPMATMVKGEDGKYRLTNASEIGVWQQAEEKPESIQKFHKSGYGYYVLKKDDGGSITAAYNPYEHSSNLVLNDQFEAAYQRPNLVTVECIIPKSEMTSGYKAKFAKDSVGYLDWKSGTVASKLKDNKRKVYLSRWLKPVRILSDAEVATMYKDILGANISVPFNVVTPQLLTELEKVGVKIDYEGSPGYQYRQSKKRTEDNTKSSDRSSDSVSNRSLLANALESVAQNDIERTKLNEYKRKISLIESEQAKLAELRAKIKELSFAKGARDTKTIKSLQFEANQTANRINTYDKQLLNLEATKALKDVLQREKQMAYKRAEQKGKDALAAYREKATKTQRELMTRYQESRKKGVENRHKTAMRHKIKDVVSELNQYLLKGTKDKHVPIQLQKAVAEALDAVNMDTVGAEERIAKLQAELMKAKTPEAIQSISRKLDRVKEMGDRMDGKLQALKNAYDEIVNSDDPLIANSHDEVISNSIAKVITEVGSTPLRDMSLAQLESVYDLYKMVLTTIRNANKTFKAAKSEEISVIANRVMDEIDGLGKKKAYRSKASQTVSKFDWNNLKPVYAFERIGSNTFTEVFNNVRAGEDTWAVDVTEAKEFSKEQRKKFKYDSWDFKKRYSFTSSSGMTFELSLEQIMSLYAYSKREQARDHLKKGGIVFDETTEVTIKNKIGIPVKFNPTEATAYNLSDETLADIIGKLNEDQKAFVDAMQDYLSTTMGEKGNEVSLALYGVKLYKEKHYFPLKSATQFMAKAKEQQKGEVKVKNSGFSKETVAKANNPIVLTPFMDVWADHVNDMSMYHAFVLPLEDFYRVYNYKTPTSDTMATESVEMYLQNSFGKGATQYIDQLLKDLNGGARVDSTVGIINKMTGLFKKSAVFGSVSVVVQQPSAIARATALVDVKYFFGKPTRSKHKETWAEVKKYAPVAIIKEMGYFDTGMGQSTVDWIKDKNTWKDKVDDVVSKAPALADEFAWCAIWKAVKRETLHTHKNLAPNSDEFLKAVGERFTEVITKTQVYDSVLARSAHMRSKDTGMKMATAFMGEPTTSINMIANAFTQLKRGDKRYARKAIGSVIASMILNSVLVSFVYAGRDDDEKKTYAEKYAGTLTEELIDSINPLTLIPFLKDIVSIVQGYDVERSDMAVITDLINAWNNLDSDNRTVYRKVEDFAGAIASIFGLPVKNIMRDARGIYNTVNSFINGEDTTGAGMLNAIEEGVTGESKSNGQQLYEAILNGDSAQIERVKGRFEDQKAINSAIRTALRENDPRIKEAAEARYNGDIAEYMRIAKEIIAEGYFKQDDVVAAINSEITALKKDEGKSDTSASSDKVKSIYEVSDYYTALVGRDQATAYVVKEDLIKTDVANGKDRDEAEADFNSKFASHLRDLHEKGELSDYDAENMLVNYGGKTYEQASAKVQYWNFKERYPDYDLSEEAVTKYYEEVEPHGINVSVYYDYTKRRAKCKGVDLNADGKTDSGSVKSQVMAVIDSLPISDAQKDALYYLNGWSANTIYEAPWH